MSALTVAYVTKGFLDHPNSKEALAIFAGRHLSELDAMTVVTETAEEVESVWVELFSDDGKYPGEWGGVWDYEVSEPVGQALAAYAIEHGEIPTSTAMRQMVMKALAGSGWKEV